MVLGMPKVQLIDLDAGARLDSAKIAARDENDRADELANLGVEVAMGRRAPPVVLHSAQDVLVKLFGKTPRLSLGGVGWVLLLGFLAYRISPQVMAAFGAGTGDSAAPAFELRTLDGPPVSLEGLRGQVVLVNFWATWCPPCRMEMPGFQRVWDSRRERGLVVLGLSNERGDEPGVRAFLGERGITYPVAVTGPGAAEAFGGVRALPTSILIDRQGRVRHRVEGFFAEPALRQAVDRLLDEPAPEGES